MVQENPVRKTWYVGDWTGLGWAETIVKLIAHAVAGIALIYALASGTYVIPDDLTFLEVLILGALSLGLTFAIVERFMQREIIAMVFVIINVIAHWGMVYALLTEPGPGSLLPLFALLMLIGDLIKLRFFSVTDFIAHSYSTVPIWLPYVMVGIFIAGYAALILLSVGSPWIHTPPA